MLDNIREDFLKFEEFRKEQENTVNDLLDQLKNIPYEAQHNCEWLRIESEVKERKTVLKYMSEWIFEQQQDQQEKII